MDNPSDVPGGGRPPRKELQGPRPTPLKVRKDSHKIKKPPIAPPTTGAQFQQQPPQQTPRQPVIIYTVSPKVIHTNPNDFMTLVQRLTGPDQSIPSTTTTTTSSVVPICSSSSSSSMPHHMISGAISPAARYASIEKTKMTLDGKKMGGGTSSFVQGQDMEINNISGDDHGVEGVERTMFFSGILSPGPSSLPPNSPNLFSPFFHDPSFFNINLNNNYNGMQHGGRSYIEGTNYTPSPFSTNFISPSTHVISPSSLDLLHHIMNS